MALNNRINFYSAICRSLGMLLPLLLFATISFAGSEYEFTGKVVGVSDGDTIKIMHLGKAEKIRLTDIDCPERKQAYGKKAKQFTSKLVFGKEVTVMSKGKDRYGRTLGEVILPDGRSLNRELLKAGLAWHYKRYSKDEDLARIEDKARKEKRGLWAGVNPIAPWELRRQ